MRFNTAKIPIYQDNHFPIRADAEQLHPLPDPYLRFDRKSGQLSNGFSKVLKLMVSVATVNGFRCVAS